MSEGGQRGQACREGQWPGNEKRSRYFVPRSDDPLPFPSQQLACA